MATFKQYRLNNGEKRWQFKTYLGISAETGKQIQTTRRGFKTQKEAKIAETRLQADYAEGQKKSRQPKTYHEVYKLWMNEYEKTVAGSTLLKTERIFRNHVLNELGHIYISEITPLKIQEIMDRWASEYSTASKMMNYTGLVFKYAIRFGYIDKNPVDAIRIPRKPREQKHEKDFYNKEELKLFLTELDKNDNLRAQVFFRLLAMSGMRKQEAAALEFRDINFRNKTIDINKAIIRTAAGLEIGNTKTVGSKRIISIDDTTLRKITEWIIFKQPKNDQQLIFEADNSSIMGLDTPRKWLIDIQNRMDKTAGRKLSRITTHGFRHTHVSLLIEMGSEKNTPVTLKQIQDRLGHDDAQTTLNIYAHVSQISREQLANDFNSFIDF
ncbi:site-specific integrase [Listeria monocytogenes]|nr:site-specific integrase [Listeria monocytogenes]EJC6460103.1 site-specific integrase [Listeria monocytogenes]